MLYCVIPTPTRSRRRTNPTSLLPSPLPPPTYPPSRFDNTPPPLEVYNFVWNRTRMIRKDFSLQNFVGGNHHAVCTEVHERVVRYHACMASQMVAEENFVSQQNTEQLGQTLKSLKEFYDAAAAEGEGYANEAELRGYFLLANLRSKGEWLGYVEGCREAVRRSPQVRFAEQAYLALSTDNYARFFHLVRRASYLQACLMAQCFWHVRRRAICIMSSGHNKQEVPLAKLVRLLELEDEADAADLCARCGMAVSAAPGGQCNAQDAGSGEAATGGTVTFDKKKFVSNPDPPPPRVLVRAVESKAVGRTRRAICDGRV